MTQVLIWLAVAMIVVAAGLTLWRMTQGPSTLDRIVSSDVLISTVLMSICLVMVISRDTSSLSILLVLAMVAFTGGVSVARMLAPGAADRQRYRRGVQEDEQ
ncbi:MAG: monovalent cation/H+ antiporter complex subunit F [Micropruina sp.]|uniref:monovalent cation/H+ antiporter complex subunit F n=1 Tax=Micropruina sp. TaxID=2737536 RepID=UPI0039E5D2AF